MWISKREYNFLVKTIDYLQTQVEQERERADRALDSLAMASGAPPVSNTGIKDRKERQSVIETFEKELQELLPDEVGELLSETPESEVV